MKSIKELRGSSPKLGKIKGLRHGNGQDAPGKICRASGGSVIDSGNEEMGGGFSKGPTSKPSKMRGAGKPGKKGMPGKGDKAGKGGATINIAIMSGTKPPGPDMMGMPPKPPGPPGPPPGPPPGAGGPPPGGPPGMPPKPPGPPMMRASGGRVNKPKMAGHSRAKP